MAHKGHSSARTHVTPSVRHSQPLGRVVGAPILNVTLPAPLDPPQLGSGPIGPQPHANSLWHDANVLQRAKQLGINAAADPDLMWIAKEAVDTPLPVGWSQHADEGQVYFVNDQTGEGSAEHPLNAYFRALLYKHKLQKAQGTPAATARPLYDLNEGLLSHLPSPSAHLPPGPQAHPNGSSLLFASPQVPRGPPIIQGAEIKIIASKPPPADAKLSGARAPVTIPLSGSPSPSSTRLPAAAAPAPAPALASAPARRPKKGRTSRRRSSSSSSSNRSQPTEDAVADLRAQVRQLQAQLQQQQHLLQQQLLAPDDGHSSSHSQRPPSSGLTASALSASLGRSSPAPHHLFETSHMHLDPAAFLLRHGVDPSGLNPTHLAALSLYTASVVERCVAEYAARYEGQNFWRSLSPPHELVERRITALEETLARLEAQRRGLPDSSPVIPNSTPHGTEDPRRGASSETTPRASSQSVQVPLLRPPSDAVGSPAATRGGSVRRNARSSSMGSLSSPSSSSGGSSRFGTHRSAASAGRGKAPRTAVEILQELED
eukprot:GGOE01003072.1.p1 GENE.GGOE01003072.1~~GGOE01003072.1.p1  ORF type:complete len:545 (-),score=110.95 GGOE01003072.1:369-2003(-)